MHYFNAILFFFQQKSKIFLYTKFILFITAWKDKTGAAALFSFSVSCGMWGIQGSRHFGSAETPASHWGQGVSGVGRELEVMSHSLCGSISKKLNHNQAAL